LTDRGARERPSARSLISPVKLAVMALSLAFLDWHLGFSMIISSAGGLGRL